MFQVIRPCVHTRCLEISFTASDTEVMDFVQFTNLGNNIPAS